MQVIFNPKDTNTFASASLDKTVKVLLGSAASPLLSHLIYRATLLSCSSLAGCMGLTDSCPTCEPATLLPCSTLASCMGPTGWVAKLRAPVCIVQVWSIGQPTPNFTLEGHDKGVNAVDYFTGGKAPPCSFMHPHTEHPVPASRPAGQHGLFVQLCTATAYP